jgi:hypothetical protein
MLWIDLEARTAMLTHKDLAMLTRWCHERRLSWQPVCADDGSLAVKLASVRAPALGRDMLLVVGPDELRLLGAPGEPLAAASDLPSLLDAVDGGVAEPA